MLLATVGRKHLLSIHSEELKNISSPLSTTSIFKLHLSKHSAKKQDILKFNIYIYIYILGAAVCNHQIGSFELVLANYIKTTLIDNPSTMNVFCTLKIVAMLALVAVAGSSSGQVEGAPTESSPQDLKTVCFVIQLVEVSNTTYILCCFTVYAKM